MSERSGDLTHKLIGVSISDSPDLARLGFGHEHLNEIIVGIARTVLRVRTDENTVISLGYGGDLRPGGFTQILFPLVKGEDPTLRDWQGRLYSFLAWPYYLSLTKADEAALINSCRFVRVTPDQVQPQDETLNKADARTPPADACSIEAKYQGSRCLSFMRNLITRGGGEPKDGGEPPLAPRLSALLILGGKLTGYSGVMPGLFEEFLLAHQNYVPIYVVGGYGGAAGALAQAILGLSKADDRWFELGYQEQHPANIEKKLPELVGEYGKHEKDSVAQPATLFAALREAVRHCRENVEGELRNGLDRHENKRLMVSEQETEILGLLGKGLAKTLAG